MRHPEGPTPRSAQETAADEKPVTLKVLAEHLQLSPTTVSVVLNRSPVADSIRPETRERVFAAAREFGYRPNYLARSLRRQRSLSVGVLVPELSEDYASGVMSGIESRLDAMGYTCLVSCHRSSPDRSESCLNVLRERQVEGVILIGAPLDRAPGLPAVAVAGHRKLEDVTNIIIDHDQAAKLVLSHLITLGHERIAFFKGSPKNSDTEDRWRAILRSADSLGLEVREDLVLQLRDNPFGQAMTPGQRYREGHGLGKQLLARGTRFTALFAFNDVSAIGALGAFREAGLKVPGEVSVVGFDDIDNAAFVHPSLTTVRQPLAEMGELAGQTLLRRLSKDGDGPDVVTVRPELVVRESSGPRAS